MESQNNILNWMADIRY